MAEIGGYSPQSKHGGVVFERNEIGFKKILSQEYIHNIKYGPKDRNILLTVISLGDSEKALLLIDNGFDIHDTDRDGSTALMLSINIPAAFFPHRVMNALISAGADVNAQDKSGATALHRACQLFALEYNTGKPNEIKHIELLLEANARVDIVDAKDQLPVERTKVQSPHILA